MDPAGTGKREFARGGAVSDAEKLIRTASEKGLRVVLAESCTAGLAASLIAEVSGASRVLWGSYVTYTPEAKQAMVGLESAVLEKHGAVSRETALAMAEGALRGSGADIAASVTGLAGPGGDGSAVPVGTVWIGLACRGGESRVSVFRYRCSRNGVRRRAARDALKVLMEGVIQKTA
jgi:PncC family amidohydrolase